VLYHVFVDDLGVLLAPESNTASPADDVEVHESFALVVERPLVDRHSWPVVVDNMFALIVHDRLHRLQVAFPDSHGVPEYHPVDGFLASTSGQRAAVMEIFVQVERNKVGNIDVGDVVVVQLLLAELGPSALKMVLDNVGQRVHAHSLQVRIVLDDGEQKSKDADSVFVGESSSNTGVMNILVDHVQLQRIGFVVDGVLGAGLAVLVVDVSPVKVHLDELVVDVQGSALEQGSAWLGQTLDGGSGVGHREVSRAEAEVFMAEQGERTVVLELGRALADVDGGLADL